MLDLPTPAQPFGADTLACAIALTGTATPTPAQLDAALLEMSPVGGPTAASLVAAGWLAPAISDRTRLRQPPLPLAEQDARLAAAEEPDKSRCFDVPAPDTAGQLDAPTTPENNTEASIAAPLLSYFRGGITATVPYAAITPAQLHAVLTSTRHRTRTEALRAAPVGSAERAELKKGLDYVTPAGTFTRRANTALEMPSGLLVLDFDHVPDLADARATLLADENVAADLILLFTSPSGDGLKAFVRTDATATHDANFNAYAAYLGRKYARLGLAPDEAGKDIARACFVPYAPDAWLAPAYARTA